MVNASLVPHILLRLYAILHSGDVWEIDKLREQY